MSFGDSETKRWQRVFADLRGFRDAERDAWGELSEELAARYLAGTCSQDERIIVEQAADERPLVRELLAVVGEVLEEPLGGTESTGGRASIRDAARTVRVPVDVIEKAIDDGELEVVRHDGEVWVSQRSLEQWRPQPRLRPVDDLANAVAASAQDDKGIWLVKWLTSGDALVIVGPHSVHAPAAKPGDLVVVNMPGTGPAEGLIRYRDQHLIVLVVTDTRKRHNE